MMSSRGLGPLLALMLSVPASALAVQTTLVDTSVSHTQASGATMSLGVTGVPADFTAPDAYATGTLHHRVIVTNRPAAGNLTTYKICFVQGANRACSDNAISIDAAETFSATQTMDTLQDYATIDWAMPLDDVEVVAMDAAGVPVDASETTWAGSPDFALYYPLDLTYQAVVVADGDAFQGFPGETLAEAPTFSPGAGTYEASVTVSLASGTADAEIRYTLDGSDPTAASPLYDGTPLTIMQTTTVKALAFAAGVDPSPVVEATYTIVAMLANGLRGRYYNGRNFGELAMTRTDPVIDFIWDGTTPSADIDNPFSVIWTGQVTPRYTDTYTFKTVNDDGVRLWVDNRLVIDDWNDHGPQERTGTIGLQQNSTVSVWLEYYNGGGPGTVTLSWESNQQPDELIPQAQMVPNLPANQTATVSLLLGDDAEIPEASTAEITLQVRRRGDIDSAATVGVTVAGTATAGEDYTSLPASVAFAAGELSKSLSFTVTDDDVVEGDETIEITLQDGAGYTVSDPATVTLTIVDNDVDIYTITGSIEYTGSESGPIVVEAFTDEDTTLEKRTTTLANAGKYTIDGVEPGSYWVVAYIDSNGNGRVDSDGEVWGQYQDANFQPALVDIPPAATGIDINLDVAPGEDPDSPGGGKDGCCATTKPRPDRLALLVLVVAVALVARRRP